MIGGRIGTVAERACGVLMASWSVGNRSRWRIGLMGAMPQTAMDRPARVSDGTVAIPVVRRIEALPGDIRATEPAPFQHKGANCALAAPVGANLARRATGCAFKMRNRP